MADRGIAAVRAKIAALPPSHSFSIPDLRALYDKATRAFPVPGDLRVEDVDAGGVPAERLTPAGANHARCLVYLHGGGYAIGSPRSHRHLAAEIARQMGVPALVPEYRLGPEAPFPAAVDDVLETYRSLLANGIGAHGITIAGDSAGGGLAVAAALAIRDANLPMPRALACLSPWADLAGGGGSYVERAAMDPLVGAEALARYSEAYLGGQDPATPYASPARADLSGLPPMLIQVGEHEVLFDDAHALERAARRAGVDVTLDVWPGMIHVWHWYWPMLDEGVTAIGAIARFLTRAGG